MRNTAHLSQRYSQHWQRESLLLLVHEPYIRLPQHLSCFNGVVSRQSKRRQTTPLPTAAPLLSSPPPKKTSWAIKASFLPSFLSQPARGRGDGGGGGGPSRRCGCLHCPGVFPTDRPALARHDTDTADTGSGQRWAPFSTSRGAALESLKKRRG